MNSEIPIPDVVRQQLSDLPDKINDDELISNFLKRRKDALKYIFKVKDNLGELRKGITSFLEILDEEKRVLGENISELRGLFTDLEQLVKTRSKSAVSKEIFKKLRIVMVKKPEEIQRIHSMSVEAIIQSLGNLDSYQSVENLYEAFKKAMQNGDMAGSRREKWYSLKRISSKKNFLRVIKEMREIISSMNQEVETEIVKLKSLNLEIGGVNGLAAIGGLITISCVSMAYLPVVVDLDMSSQDSMLASGSSTALLISGLYILKMVKDNYDSFYDNTFLQKVHQMKL